MPTKSAPSMVEEATIEPLTPELAEKLLEANQGNRPINMAQVENLTRLMQEGLWRFNGDSIRIAKDGTLLDGQHRCMACAHSGVTLPMQLFVRGLENETQATMDQGRKRTASDVLAMAGIGNGNQIASVARMVNDWKHGKRTISELSKFSRMQLTNDEVRMWAEADPNLVQAAKVSVASGIKAICTQKAAGTLWFLLNEADAEKCTEFFELLESGAGLEKGNPILTVRNFWTNLRVQKGSMPVARYLDAGIRGWNRWLLGEPLSLISQRLEKDIPEVLVPGTDEGAVDTVNHWPNTKRNLTVVPDATTIPDLAETAAAEAPAKPKPRRKSAAAATTRLEAGDGSLFAER